eukprot:3665198-Rhodomonas_salina.1
MSQRRKSLEVVPLLALVPMGTSQQHNRNQLGIPILGSTRRVSLRLAKFSGGGSDGANGEWQPRRVVYSSKILYFTRQDDEAVVDIIPLHEITDVEEVGGDTQRDRSVRRSLRSLRGSFHGNEANGEDEESKDTDNNKDDGEKDGTVMKTLAAKDPGDSQSFKLHTLAGGHNSGRLYHLKPENGGDRAQIVEALRHHVKKAIEVERDLSRFQRSQENVRRVFTSLPFQSTVAFLIFANFATQ